MHFGEEVAREAVSAVVDGLAGEGTQVSEREEMLMRLACASTIAVMSRKLNEAGVQFTD